MHPDHRTEYLIYGGSLTDRPPSALPRPVSAPYRRFVVLPWAALLLAAALFLDRLMAFGGQS